MALHLYISAWSVHHSGMLVSCQEGLSTDEERLQAIRRLGSDPHKIYAMEVGSMQVGEVSITYEQDELRERIDAEYTPTAEDLEGPARA
jgi:hypothetical protein